MLSKDAITEFQDIYFKKYGEILTLEEAAAQAEDFLRFFKAIVKPSIKGSNNDHPKTIT